MRDAALRDALVAVTVLVPELSRVCVWLSESEATCVWPETAGVNSGRHSSGTIIFNLWTKSSIRSSQSHRGAVIPLCNETD